MSRVNYVVCDICGENIESKHNSHFEEVES